MGSESPSLRSILAEKCKRKKIDNNLLGNDIKSMQHVCLYIYYIQQQDKRYTDKIYFVSLNLSCGFKDMFIGMEEEARKASSTGTPNGLGSYFNSL